MHGVAEVLRQPLDAWAGHGPTQSCVICRCGRRSEFHFTLLDAAVDHIKHVQPDWAALPAIRGDHETMLEIPCDKGDRLAAVLREIAVSA